MRKIAAIGFATALIATPAVASTDTDAFEKSGLTGKWAYDCAKPASEKNFVDTWSVVDGKVVRASDLGKPDPKPTKAATFGVGKTGRIYYQATGAIGVLTVELLVEAKRYRLWSSEDVMPLAGGQVYVVDGKSKDGGETQWYNKCD
ncbi:MAG: hypothetical protein JNL06_04520 [Alphaproteobacteria bacterium]|nr:hypothetical protein [Alphaproteobacteria bacterium]